MSDHQNKSLARGLTFTLFVWLLAAGLGIVFGASGTFDWQLVSQLRIPRVILASAQGASLAIAGMILQALFFNPLCEPYTLGISSGAALGAVLGAVLGLEWIWAGLALPAFVGALLFAAILYGAAAKRGFETVRLLLTGVVLGFFGSSCVAIAMAVSSSSGLGGVLYWLLGDLSRAQLGGSLFTLSASVILILWIYRSHRELDALLLGEEVARSLGVSTTRLRRKLIFVSSVLVALCVSSGGMIGFVGLIVPHLVRRWFGALHRSLIPVGAITGAAAVVLADTLARVLLPQQEIPVGVVTALLGAPLFALILFKKTGISGVT